MAFDKLINRNRASALIPQEYADEIWKAAPQSSAVMQMARRLPNLTSDSRQVPVLDLLPQAYFVGEKQQAQYEEGTRKKTTKAIWEKKYISPAEIACIVPVPNNVLDDSKYPIWEEVMPLIAEAAGNLFDRAVINGAAANAPGVWPNGLVPMAFAAGAVLGLGQLGDLYDDILGGYDATTQDTGLVGMLEESGYFPTGYMANIRIAGWLRGLRDLVGQPIFKAVGPNENGVQGRTNYTLDGLPVFFPRNGAILPDDPVLLICADWDKIVYAVRTEIQWKVAEEAAIFDDQDNLMFNSYQEDMTLLRMTFRLGWQVANPTNRVAPNAIDPVTGQVVQHASRLPFSVLVQGDVDYGVGGIYYGGSANGDGDYVPAT